MKTRLRIRWPFWAGLLLLASAAASQQQPPQPAPGQQVPPTEAENIQATAKPRADRIVLPAGTRLPLVLHNSVSTRNIKPGDPVYLETLFPVMHDGRVVIPAGSYVQGEVIEAKRPGKIKGRGELLVRLNAMILPNGYMVDFNAVPTNTGAGGNETVEQEGKIKGDSDKSGDVGTVAKTTTAGAGIGAIAGRSGKGVGIGAAAGVAAGLAAVLLTRGPELELPRGTTLDVMLDRPLYLDADKVQFTDPGRASPLAGPDRQPPRQRIPF